MSEPLPPSVFVCDDSFTIRSHLAMLLGPVAKVEAFESGEALLDAAAHHCPDLIISDVMMEGIDGYEVCRRVRGTPALAGVPVILLTSENAEDARANGLEQGADDYLVKPVKPRELIARATSLARLRCEVVERQRIEEQLRLSQKLESLGRISGGIAHEINTPIQYISDNCAFLKDAVGDLLGLVEQYQQLLGQLAAGKLPAAQALANAQAAEQKSDLEFVRAEAPVAIDRSLDGCKRVANIVRAMKEFAHPDRKTKTATDLNHTVQTTLAIAANEYKHVAELELDLQPLPQIAVHAGELGQVLLNLIVNAAHAIDECSKTRGRGKIRIATRGDSGGVSISITDTGAGIPEAVRAKVFDPFFTTKEVGKGTGQGLALAHAVIVKGHGGTISFESEVGVGTTFTLRLPAHCQTSSTSLNGSSAATVLPPS